MAFSLEKSDSAEKNKNNNNDILLASSLGDKIGCKLYHYASYDPNNTVNTVVLFNKQLLPAVNNSGYSVLEVFGSGQIMGKTYLNKMLDTKCKTSHVH